MKIGIIGGTGGMGKGFALRFCKKHAVIIGSRDAERAKTAANEYKLRQVSTLAWQKMRMAILMEQSQEKTIFQLQMNLRF